MRKEENRQRSRSEKNVKYKIKKIILDNNTAKKHKKEKATVIFVSYIKTITHY